VTADDEQERVFEALLKQMLKLDNAQIEPGITRTTRNGSLLRPGERALPGLTDIGDYRIVVRDETRSTVCFAGQLWFGDEAAICAVRLKIADDAIAECEIIRGPARFPGVTGVDPATLGAARPAFLESVPAETRLSREAIADIACGYYDAVNQARPELAALHPAGDRIEQGTCITRNPDFRFEFYVGLDGQDLPNFGLWSARDQFMRRMWDADRVFDVRFPCVDPRLGLACGFMTYRPWGKRGEVEIEGVGRVGPLGDPARRVSLNAMEVFKVDEGAILAMETVWSIEDAGFRSTWVAGEA